VEIEFSEVQSSVVQHYGIDLNTFVYVSQQLLQLRRSLPSNTKVTVKAPLHDAGHIWVWDPQASTYFKVANKDTQYAGLTVTQAKTAKKLKAEPGSAYARTGAQAMDVVRAEASEAQKHQKLSVRRAGAKLADRTSARARKAQTTPSAPQNAPVHSPVITLPRDEELIDISVSLPPEVLDVA
jgi:putative transposase